MTAKVSGGKLNPAVSLGLLVSGSISARPPNQLHSTTFLSNKLTHALTCSPSLVPRAA